MRYRHSRLFPIVLVLIMLTSCGQSAEKPDLKQGMSQLLNTVQNLPPGLGIELQTEWPSDSAPAELSEYTAGTITASAVDGDGVLTIKIADTSKTYLYSYLDAL